MIRDGESGLGDLKKGGRYIVVGKMDSGVRYAAVRGGGDRDQLNKVGLYSPELRCARILINGKRSIFHV